MARTELGARPFSGLPSFVAFAGIAASPAFAPADAPLRLAHRIPLPGVSGRIDHLAVDPTGRRLFVAALGNDTVEAIDLERALSPHISPAWTIRRSSDSSPKRTRSSWRTPTTGWSATTTRPH